MWPDRVSNQGPLTYESGAPTDCATRPSKRVVRFLTLDHRVAGTPRLNSILPTAAHINNVI